jgi:hypothetical protein
MPIQGQYAMPAFQPASFTPYYGGAASGLGQGIQSTAQQSRATQLASIEAGIDASAQDELARRNEATAMRQNQSAMLNRGGTRAGGGRYRRLGLFTPGGSGLDQANATARTAARKKAAYATFEADEARKAEAESKAAMNAYANRFIGYKNGALYL